MPIRFNCACGKAFKVGDEHAGKRTKCPSCGAATVVPPPEEEVLEAEVVEDEVLEAEVVEEAVPEKKRAPAIASDDEPRMGGKKKRRRRPPEREGPMSRMYAEQARRDLERDKALARTAGGWHDDDDEGHGWTMFGVHITAGVLSGAGMLFFGLLAMALIAIFKEDDEVTLGPRAYIAAIVFTALGAIVLVKALVFGEED